MNFLDVENRRAIIDRRAIADRLQRTYSTAFDVTQKVDPELIGGLRITMGDRRIDGTVAGRLDELSRTLFANI